MLSDEQRTKLLQDMPGIVLAALRKITHERFYENERAFCGQFSTHLHDPLSELLAKGSVILEQEHQKKIAIHGTRQRPDLILHIPSGASGNAKDGNYVFWFFKALGGRA